MRLMRNFAVSLLACSMAHGAQPNRARQAMAVSGETNATRIGVEVLRSGGNAVDAAIAMGFALAVTHSGMCGLGGGGHAVVRLADGKAAFLDFREQAPGQASRSMFINPDGSLSRDSVVGWRASAVPGTVMGFDTLHRRFGSKPWADLLAPAVRLARDGHTLSFMRAEALRASTSLAADPESKRIFLNGGRYYEMGDRLSQPELGSTLDRIAKNGAREFYEGETARRFASEMSKHGGLISAADLKKYAVAEGEPLRGSYRGYDIVTAAGSSSGGVGVLQMLAVLEGTGFEKYGANSAGALHIMAEAMRRFFADRSDNIGDPAFYQTPFAKLLDPGHIRELRASIDPQRATPSARIRPGNFGSREGGHTTHYAVVDARGNAIAVTFTLNSQFGSGVTVPGLGFILNDNMDNFAANPGKTNQYGLVQGEANAIQPGKRPVSSMAPTIIAKGGKLFMVVGTPGGPTILNSVMQAIVNVIDFGMNAQDAVNAPRIHHQWQPDKIFMEPGFSPDTVAALRARGHEIEFKASNNDLNMILLDGRYLQGAVDPRREAEAAGY